MRAVKQRMSAQRWVDVLRRWSPFPDSPEKNLICYFLAQSIVEEPSWAASSGGTPFERGFFAKGEGFDLYCQLIGLDPQFMREMIDRAADFEATK